MNANVFARVWAPDALLGAADTGMPEPRWPKGVALEAERAFSEVRPGSEGQARAMTAAACRACPRGG